MLGLDIGWNMLGFLHSMDDENVPFAGKRLCSQRGQSVHGLNLHVLWFS